jgi:hypothetical protein
MKQISISQECQLLECGHGVGPLMNDTSFVCSPPPPRNLFRT